MKGIFLLFCYIIKLMDKFDTASDLIEAILQAARDAGIREGDLANNAGLTPVGLSKAKKRGDLRVSTLLRLAQQVGLDVVLDPAEDGKGPLIRALKAGRLLELKDDADDE